MLLYLLGTIVVGLVALLYLKQRKPQYDGPKGLPYLGMLHRMKPDSWTELLESVCSLEYLLILTLSSSLPCMEKDLSSL